MNINKQETLEETSKKLIARLWNCDLPLSIKLFGSLQLFNNYIYAFILLTGLLSVPLMLLKNKSMEFDYFFNWSGMLISVLIINFFYCFTAILMDKKNILASIKEMLSTFPIAIIVSMGMSYHNTIAVLKGIQGQKTAFIRTPKFSESKRENSYLKSQKIRQYIPESLLFIYFLLAAITELYFKDFGFLVYHLLMLSGFGFILYCAFKENSAQ